MNIYFFVFLADISGSHKKLEHFVVKAFNDFQESTEKMKFVADISLYINYKCYGEELVLFV